MRKSRKRPLSFFKALVLSQTDLICSSESSEASNFCFYERVFGQIVLFDVVICCQKGGIVAR